MTERGKSYEGVSPAGHAPAGGKLKAPDGQHRVALIIGNGAYAHASPLTNPTNDARAMTALLSDLAFDVINGLDVARDPMEDLLFSFERKVAKADVSLLFYAGHGLQVKGRNYLLPIDANIEGEVHLKRRAFSLNEILDIMGRNRRTSIVFLDACRNNPFARQLRELGIRDAGAKGLAKVDRVPGSLIAFATEADNVAQDGRGSNSPFTSALLKHIPTSGLSLTDMMIDVRNDVMHETDRGQQPWVQYSLEKRFYFVPEEIEPVQPIQQAQSTTASPRMSDAAEEWAAIKDTTSLPQLALFKERYAETRWSENADIRIGELRLADQQRREAEAARVKAAEDQHLKTEQLAAMAAAISQPANTKAAATEQLSAPAAATASSRKHEPSAKKPFPFAKVGGGAAIAVAALLAIWQSWKQPVPPVRNIVQESSQTRTAVVKQPAVRLPFEPEMVRVPGGTFRMGCVSGKSCQSDEKPVHRVTIKPFEVGKYEVTFAQWDACVSDGGCTHKPGDEGWGRGKRPVINVSWDDITKQYLPWLNGKTGNAYRLLTEAEWEYAARAGSEKKYSWGNGIDCDKANYGNGLFSSVCKSVNPGKTKKAGSYDANKFGLKDMHGNVWEWVQDCFTDSYKGAPKDGSKVPDISSCRRVVRGGSWGSFPRNLRSANRNWYATDNRNYNYGFRLARTLNP